LIASAAVAGCPSGHPGVERVRAMARVTRSLVAFVGDGPERTFVVAGAPQARWLAGATGVVPVLAGRDPFTLAIRVDDLEGDRLRGACAVLARSPPAGGAAPAPPVGSATFRIHAAAAPGAAGTLLLERRVEGRPGETTSTEFSIELPAMAGQRWVVLEAVPHDSAADRPEVVWIDPTLEGLREAATGALPGHPWNAVLVTLDTTRRDALGPYGGKARTPNLDRLARRGQVFENAYSVAFGTTPAHASLLTGSHALRHGVYDNQSILDASHATLAEVLRERGYTTAAFVSARPVSHALGFIQGFDRYDDLFLAGLDPSLGAYAQHERRAGATVARFLLWLAEQPERPFFSWIHFFDPHQPYAPTTAPPSEPGSAGDEVERQLVATDGSPAYLDATRILREHPALLPRIARRAHERYLAEIEAVDAALGQLLDALAARDLERKTLVVVVADHGENFLEHRPELAFHHATLRDQVSHVPLLLALPSRQGAGTRRSALVGTTDISPTLLDLLGVAAPADWTGRSFRRVITGSAGQRFRDHLVLEGAHRHEIGVRTERWLYREVAVENRADAAVTTYLGLGPAQPFEVYDLVADPLARAPLDPGSLPELGPLRDLLARFLAGRRAARAAPLGSSAHQEALRALGYLR
jgi:arylsulfatase A-like enzyme